MAGKEKGQGKGPREDLMSEEAFEAVVVNGMSHGDAQQDASTPAAVDVSQVSQESVVPSPKIDMSGIPSSEGELMSPAMMQVLYGDTAGHGFTNEDVPPELNIGLLHITNRASDFLNDLEAAVNGSVKDDMEVDMNERATIWDAKKRTGSSHEAMVSLVANHLYILYHDIKNKPAADEAQKEAYAIKAIKTTMHAAKNFPMIKGEEEHPSTYSPDNVYKVVMLQNLVQAPLSRVSGLEAEFKKFEEKYKEYGFDKKLYALYPHFSEDIRMQLSLMHVLKEISPTVIDDLNIDDSEINLVQERYSSSPITKYELLTGVISLLSSLLRQVENISWLSEGQREYFKGAAVDSAIRIRKEIRKKETDQSRDTDMDALLFKFGFSLGASEDKIKEYKKSFTKADYLGQFLNALDNILKDWVVQPQEYIMFDHVLMSADLSFGEGLDYASEILVRKLRDYEEGQRKALTGKGIVDMQKKAKMATRKQAQIAADALAALIVYRLGSFPKKGDNTTQAYFELLSRYASRIINYPLSNETFEKAIQNPENIQKTMKDGEFCRKRFMGEIPGTTTERMIQDEIERYGIATILRGLDYENAKRELEGKGFEMYVGQPIFLTSGIDVAVVKMIDAKQSQKCEVMVSIDGEADISFDQQTRMMGINLGKYRKMNISGKLEARVENGMITSIDTEKAGQEEILFIHKTALKEPEKKIEDAEQPFLPLKIEVDFTFQSFIDRYGLKNAAMVRGTSPFMDLDRVTRHAREKPGDLKFDGDAIKGAEALYLPLSNFASSSFNSTDYNGILMVEPSHDFTKWRRVNGSEMLIPLKRTYFIRNGDYNIMGISQGQIIATESHYGVGNQQDEAMYLCICKNPKDANYGVTMLFMDTGEKRRINYVPFAVLAGPVVGLTKNVAQTKHVLQK